MRISYGLLLGRIMGDMELAGETVFTELAPQVLQGIIRESLENMRRVLRDHECTNDTESKKPRRLEFTPEQVEDIRRVVEGIVIRERGAAFVEQEPVENLVH